LAATEGAEAPREREAARGGMAGGSSEEGNVGVMEEKRVLRTRSDFRLLFLFSFFIAFLRATKGTRAKDDGGASFVGRFSPLIFSVMHP